MRALAGTLCRVPSFFLFVGLVILYAATATYDRASADIVAAETPAWALGTRGTLDLTGIPHRDLPWYFEHNGGRYSDRFPGAILYLVPAYWAAGLFGTGDFSMAPGAVTAAVVAAGAVVVLRQVFRQVLPTERRVWAATLFVALGTGAWSLAAHAPWSHTLDLLLIALGLRALSRNRWLLAGLPLGLSVATRPTMAVSLAVIGLVLLVARRSIRPPTALALGALPGVSFLFCYNGLLFGRWGPSNGHELSGEIALRLSDLPLNVLGALFSSSSGLFVFYPVILLALLLIVPTWREAFGWEKAAALAGVAVLITQLSLNRYSGGVYFYGPRLLIEPLALAAPLLVRAVSHLLDRFSGRFAVPVVALAFALGVLMHGVGGVLFHSFTGL